jgi:hypothetical protein
VEGAGAVQTFTPLPHFKELLIPLLQSRKALWLAIGLIYCKFHKIFPIIPFDIEMLSIFTVHIPPNVSEEGNGRYRGYIPPFTVMQRVSSSILFVRRFYPNAQFFGVPKQMYGFDILKMISNAGRVKNEISILRYRHSWGSPRNSLSKKHFKWHRESSCSISPVYHTEVPTINRSLNWLLPLEWQEMGTGFLCRIRSCCAGGI